jgi:hypothetical protein
MSNPINSHNPNRIGDLIDHTIITHADPPVVSISGQFSDTGRAWIIPEGDYARNYTVVNAARKTTQVFLGGTLE